MNRYFSLIPVVIIFTTACDQKAPTVESAPRMVKVAQVTAVGNTQQRTFPARIESGDSTELSFKRGGQVESLDIRQGASVAQGQTLARLNAREAQQRVNERQTAASAGRETLIVPAEAVFNPDNRPKNEPVVWVVKGDNAHRYLEERKVTVGEVTSQGVAITDGLRAGEQVVAAGVSELHAGQPVRVWTRERGL
ncbi:biotin/lipoyl-binding protein [Klebsiella pneumoniae]